MDFRGTKDGLCECILKWVPLSLNFLHFLRLQQHWCALLVISASNSSLCALPFSPALSPVLQLWPLLCDLYDISDSAHFFLLYFWLSAVYLSALCLMRPCVLTAHAEDGGQTSLNVYSNMSHQWCYARWTECNHMLYVFIRLWLPLFLLPISFSISLRLCYSALLYEKLLWMPFPPRLPCFYF